MTLIDTAEMYADGIAEEIVGEAFAGRRDEIFVVSKVLPENATRRGTVAACERSLKRLRTDRIDLYLLHWRGRPPLAETLEAFAALVKDGKIRHWGVSNFDAGDMEELWGLERRQRGRHQPGALQPLASRHRIRSRARVPQTARPDHGLFADRAGTAAAQGALKDIAARHNATPAQVALAWLLQQDGIIVIPKAATAAHVRENRAATDIQLTQADLAALDRAFPPPTRSRPLEML